MFAGKETLENNTSPDGNIFKLFPTVPFHLLILQIEAFDVFVLKH